MARRSCAKFLKSAMRGCQGNVNFTLKPLFKGKCFIKPVNKGLQKMNAHLRTTETKLFLHLTYLYPETIVHLLESSKKALEVPE